MNPIRRATLLAALLASSFGPLAVQAQDFPNKPIKFVVGYAAGGAVEAPDLVAADVFDAARRIHRRRDRLDLLGRDVDEDFLNLRAEVNRLVGVRAGVDPRAQHAVRARQRVVADFPGAGRLALRIDGNDRAMERVADGADRRERAKAGRRALQQQRAGAGRSRHFLDAVGTYSRARNHHRHHHSHHDARENQHDVREECGEVSNRHFTCINELASEVKDSN